MRRALWWGGGIISTIVGVGLVVGGSCGWAGAKVMREVMDNQLAKQEIEYQMWGWCTRGLPWVGEFDKWLDNKTVIVLLQNSNELRPSGGFMGSYMRIKTNEKGIEDIHVQDIYVPDGQLPGHVEPPYPIQEAFGQGWWKLRDANWAVDFKEAAQSVAWFLEQGGEDQIDGVIAINLKLVKQLLGIVDGVQLQTYDEVVTEKNIDQLAQKYAEINWQPGSTQKRDFLGAVGENLKMKMQNLNWKGKVELAKLIYKELKRGEILMWFEDADWQAQAELRGWAGRIKANQPEADYLYLVESNLGANKANCCVKREMKQEVGKDKNKRTNKVIVKWENDNPFENPAPPVFWGGTYVNYVRLVTKKGKENIQVRVGEKELRQANEVDFEEKNSERQGLSEEMFGVENRNDYTVIGFWVVVKAGETNTAEVRFESELDQKPYQVFLQRQPGMEPFKYRLEVEGKLGGEGIIERDGVRGGLE